MRNKEYYEIENREWLDALEYIIQNDDPSRVRDLLSCFSTKHIKPELFTDARVIHLISTAFHPIKNHHTPGVPRSNEE
jgi:pyruvate dehydrogenase complex dehydrogenase (E1) component